MKKNIAPLSNMFLLTAMIGFFISAVYIMPKSSTWGVTMLLFFSVMFLAAFQSMTQGPPVDFLSKRK